MNDEIRNEVIRLLKGCLDAMSSQDRLDNWAQDNEESIILVLDDMGVVYGGHSDYDDNQEIK